MTGPAGRHPARRRLLLACLALWLCAFAVSHIPARSLPKVPVSDKKLHWGGFFVLALVTMLTLSAHGRRFPRRALACLAIAAVYAAFDERTQPLVNRYCSMGDFVADVTGAATAIIVFEIVAALRRRRGRRSRTVRE